MTRARACLPFAIFVCSISVAACKAKENPTGTSPATSSSADSNSATLSITVDGSGYHPTAVRARAGQATRVVFTRTDDLGCGQSVVFPSMGIRKELPLNKPVAVDIVMPASGVVAFACGMNMLRGSIVAE
ncbi:MAG: cupredoxin domain-containing protein [Polyangiaceae bacterium]|nr:cupredoxin domain-containing protein [Polyangiaceae bacterium]